MIYNAIISAVTCKNSKPKKSDRILRNKYITQKYNERSIVNRYFNEESLLGRTLL